MVVGLGANGSSTLYHLSGTGRKVIGIDRFTPPHTHGSSHGESRIIRQAYYEDPVYVPLLRAAYKEWEKLERVSGKKLFLKTGGLMLGNKDTAVVRGSSSAQTHTAYPMNTLTPLPSGSVSPPFAHTATR